MVYDPTGRTNGVVPLHAVPDAVDGMQHLVLRFRTFLTLPPAGIVEWLLADPAQALKPDSGAGDAAGGAWLDRLVAFVLPYLQQRYADRRGIGSGPNGDSIGERRARLTRRPVRDAVLSPAVLSPPSAMEAAGPNETATWPVLADYLEAEAARSIERPWQLIQYDCEERGPEDRVFASVRTTRAAGKR